MVPVHQIPQEDLAAARRSATIGGIDARLSVWVQEWREAARLSSDGLLDGLILYQEKVGRSALALVVTPL